MTTTHGRSLEQLASLAVAGDRAALSELLAEMQSPLYRHALRFLGNRADAEDATQEILILITTHLAQFQGRSKFTTWTYSIATRALLRSKPGRVEQAVGNAEDYASFLDTNLQEGSDPADEIEDRELIEEVRISCTYGMMLCLSRPVRAAYLLGDVLGMNALDGATICECTPAAFRQRLARGRRAIRSIIDGRCGVIDAKNPCSCSRQVAPSIAAGIMDPASLTFVDHPRIAGPAAILDPEHFDRVADQIETIVEIGNLYRRDRFAAPEAIWDDLKRTMPELINGTPPPSSRSAE